MYKGYDLKIEKKYFSENYLHQGTLLMSQRNTAAQKELDNFFENDQILSATKMMEGWFPSVKADVFI